MKSLSTLLKLAKRDLETLRRALAALLQRQASIEGRIRAHEQMLAREQALALKDYESQRAYGGFAPTALAARRALEAELEAVGEEINRMRVLIAEAHTETRKFERLLELETERAKKAADKRENAEMDEFATMRTARVTPR